MSRPRKLFGDGCELEQIRVDIDRCARHCEFSCVECPRLRHGGGNFGTVAAGRDRPGFGFIVSNWRAGDGLPANDIQELKESPMVIYGWVRIKDWYGLME